MILAFGAFGVGFLRAWAAPAVSDAAFHLVRTGSAVLEGSLEPFATSPGGDGSPILGAILTALGAALSGGVEPGGASAFLGMTRLTASVAVGGTAAALAAALVQRADRTVAVLGVAFLVLPPAFSTSFLLHPDAGVGGLLLTLAFIRRSPAWAWVATLATPVALPAAILLSARRAVRRESIVAGGLVVVVVGALSASLPPGWRGEIVAGLATGWSPYLDGIPSTLDALRRVWAGGALVIAPVVLSLRGSRSEGGSLLGPWLGTLVTAALLAEPGAFRAATPALIPPTCLLLVERIGRLADPGGPVDGPRRPVLLAMLVPVALLVLGATGDRAHREDELQRTARLAQLDAFARENLTPGAIASDDTGTLAALSARTVVPLRAVSDSTPRVVVFRGGIPPASPEALRLFDGPTFLARYAPLELRRGPTNRILDAVWIRREAPSPEPVPRAYARALRAAWSTPQSGDAGAARRAWEAAARLEPTGLGHARQALGVVLEGAGDAEASAAAFREASGDPASVRARGHLADRALSAGRLAEADSLVGQAFHFNPHLGEVWGTRARLLLHAGYFEEARSSASGAVVRNPWHAKILANFGSVLWSAGEQAQAREMWHRAVNADARILGFLGDYRKAPDDSPAPPLAPLYSEVGFGVPPE